MLNRCFLIMHEIKTPRFHLCSQPALYSKLILIYIFFLLLLYFQNTWLHKHFHMLLFSSSSDIADWKNKHKIFFFFIPICGKDHCQSSGLTSSPCMYQLHSLNNESDFPCHDLLLLWRQAEMQKRWLHYKSIWIKVI